MMKIINVVAVLITSVPLSLIAQNAIRDMERKKQQMERDIAYTSTLINQTQEKQRANIDHLNLLKAKIDKRRALLKSIDSQLLSLSKEIEMRQIKTQQLTSDMVTLKENYAQMLRIAYRSHNSYSQLMYILASDNINQAYRRISYLKKFSDALVEHAQKISTQSKSLTEEILALQKSKTEQEQLLQQEKNEVVALNEDVKNYENVVIILKRQETALMRDLEIKKQEATLLNRQIEAAIAEETRRELERQKREREHQERIEQERLAAELKKNKGNVITIPPKPTSTAIESRFEKLKGTLKMPVMQGIIVTQFGVHTHPVFPHIHVTSNGIDISTDVGAIVNVVAEGVVRKIFTTNSVTSILVQHDVYYTVYTHLDNVKVQTNDMVRAGQPLGTVEASNDRAILHFEIWKQLEKQDPEAWLIKK
jgi:septal ring factor EnvC (AmiA/AmiB activator)